MSEELDQIIRAVKLAGREILKYYHAEYSVEEKADKTLVTGADLASNRTILNELKDLDVGVLSEELADDKSRLGKDRVLIVDPMDGTMDFIKKTGDFTIMAGLVEKGKPVLGVVYKPVNDILYYAEKGEGGFIKRGERDAERINVSEKEDFSEFEMVGSRFHRSEVEAELIKKLGIPQVVGCGSAGLKIGLIAEGKAELHFNPSDKTFEWDVCAADIILSEAGGRLTDVKGEEFSYNKEDPRNRNGYLSSNGKRHEDVVRELGEIVK